jgi:hypothetical protein
MAQGSNRNPLLGELVPRIRQKAEKREAGVGYLKIIDKRLKKQDKQFPALRGVRGM